jgi:signal transduction histidine kinase
LTGHRLAVSILLAATVATCAYWLLRRRPDHLDVMVALGVSGIVAVGLTFVTPHSPAVALISVVVIRVAQWWPTPVAVAYSSGLGLGYVIGHYAINDSSGWIIAGAAVVISALLVGFMRRQNYELEREAQQAREERARSAALDERARIAREIHDVLAHSLAALSLQLDVADAMLEKGRQGQAHDSIRRASRLAKEGMAETRRAVDALRGDTLPMPELLAVLSDSYRLDTESEATVDIEGEPRELPADVSLTLYRTAQEAITNIRKHAPGAKIKIDLRYATDNVELVVANGPGPGGDGPLAAAGGGYGLTGLRERAELAGGVFAAGSDGEGWRVDVRIPA